MGSGIWGQGYGDTLGTLDMGTSFGVMVMLGSQYWGDDGDVGVPLSAGSDVGVAVLG